MSKSVQHTESGLKITFPNNHNLSEKQNLIGAISTRMMPQLLDDNTVLIQYEDLFMYRNKSEPSFAVNNALLLLKVPLYAKLKFEILDTGKINQKSFKITLNVYNSQKESINLTKKIGQLYIDQSKNEYFLNPIDSNFLDAWNAYTESTKQPENLSSINYRLENYSKLQIAYEALGRDGNSILDRLKIMFIENLDYELIADELGSLDIRPTFEGRLEKFNGALNATAEGSDTFGSRASYRDKKGKKQYELFFKNHGEAAWKNFHEIKRLPKPQRTQRIKESSFIREFPPKKVIGELFSSKIVGFTLDNSETVARDNSLSNSWNDGLSDYSVLLHSTSEASYAITLRPTPDLYVEIKSVLRQFENKASSEKIDQIDEENTFFIESLKDSFSKSQLEDVLNKIEKAQIVEIDDENITAAKSTLVDLKNSDTELIKWMSSDGKSIEIPKESLRQGILNWEKREKPKSYTVGVKIRQEDHSETSDYLISENWFGKYTNEKYINNSPLFDPKIKLRPHQIIGFSWLHALAIDEEIIKKIKSRGALLADDMGVGKTIQVIRLIAEYKSNPLFQNKPILIVAPVSLLETSWEEDGLRAFLNKNFIDRYNIINIKDLKVQIPKGILLSEIIRIEGKSTSGQDFSEIELSQEVNGYLKDFANEINDQIILCSYETLRSRIFELASVDFSLVILDEAQKIKNIVTGQAKSAKALKAHMKIAMTGTPIENSITDLWSIAEFVNPGHLDNLDDFKRKYSKKIQLTIPGSKERQRLAKQLESDLFPIWMRRTKKEVFQNGEIPNIVHYDSIFNSVGELTNKHLTQMSDQQYLIFQGQTGYFNECRGGYKLAAIKNMLEACYAPWWSLGLKFDISNIVKLFELCPKLKITFDILTEIANSDEKALIFVNVKDLQHELASLIPQWYLKKFGAHIECQYFNSDFPQEQRKLILSKFKSAKGFRVLIISPRTGGAGLNLMHANHVIHYTREWNPALERQATDRAYRMGQTKTVHVYYPTSSLSERNLVSAEEKVANILRAKREIIDDFTISAESFEITESDFGDLRYTSENIRITASNLISIDPYKFEKLIALYFEKEGYRSLIVGKAGDNGCDIVCMGSQKNLIVQVKHNQTGKPTGTKAIQEIRGAKSHYENKYGVLFDLVAATNTIFSVTAESLAINGDLVNLITKTELDTFLKRHRIFLSDIS
ncbi:MAG: SNF2-related protein [Bdellovibrio sp.]